MIEGIGKNGKGSGKVDAVVDFEHRSLRDVLLKVTDAWEKATKKKVNETLTAPFEEGLGDPAIL